MTSCCRSLVSMVGLVLSAALFVSCADKNTTEVVRVALRNSETFRYPTLVGDEEGAIVSTQAHHYTVSEIRRDSLTGWDAVYFYRAAAGYAGLDNAEIKIFTGSDGASPNDRAKTVRFYFEIRN